MLKILNTKHTMSGDEKDAKPTGVASKHVIRGKLKLKGGKGSIKAKKAKAAAKLQRAAAAATSAALAAGGDEDLRTDAQKRTDTVRAEREARKIQKLAGKTHRERIEEYNSYLDKVRLLRLSTPLVPSACVGV